MSITNRDYVITPGGYRLKSATKHADSGIAIIPAAPMTRAPRSTKIKAFSKQAHLPLTEAFRQNLTAREPDTINPAWVAYTAWNKTGATPVAAFKADWVVPPPPVKPDRGQIIFIFIGIQSSGHIVQPVLQWGKTGAGGGEYWAIASWYAQPQASASRYSDLVPVNPGDQLTAVITIEPAGGNQYTYTCGFDGQNATKLTVPGIPPLNAYCVTLESYNISEAGYYPDTPMTAITNVGISNNTGTLKIPWQPSGISELGEHAVIIPRAANQAEIDLHYSAT